MPGNLNRESSPAVARAASNGGDGPAGPSPRNSVVGNGNAPHINANGSGTSKVLKNGDSHHSKGLSPLRSTVSPSGRRSSPSAAASATSGRPPLSSRNSIGGGGQSGSRSAPRDAIQ